MLGMSQEQTCEFVQRLPLDAALERLEKEQSMLETDVFVNPESGAGYGVNYLVSMWNRRKLQSMAGQALAYEAELYVEQQNQ